MDHEALLDSLRASPIARDLPPEELRRLAEAGTVRRTTEGEVLLSENERGDRLVVLLDGDVEVVKSGGDGEPVELCRLGSGSVLGEVGMILDRPATATVRTLSPCRVFELERSAFEEMVSAGSRPALAIALALSRLLAARLQRTNEQAVDLCARAERELRSAGEKGVTPRQVDSLIAFKNKLISEWNF